MKAISIIIPVFNAENYIKQCVDSVLSQTFGDFELVLVDDGSSDSSPAICDEYAARDNRVVVIHGQNKGTKGALNTGLSAASGKYFVFMDNDDYLDKTYFEKMHEAIEKTKTKIAAAGWRMVNEQGTSRLKELIPSAGLKKARKLAKSPYYMCCFGHLYWGKIYEAEFFKKNNFNFDEGDLGLNYNFYSELAKQNGSVCIISEPLYYYRLREKSSSRAVKQNSEKLMDCFSYVESFGEKTKFDYIFSQLVFALWQFFNSDKNEMNKNKKLISKKLFAIAKKSRKLFVFFVFIGFSITPLALMKTAFKIYRGY